MTPGQNRAGTLPCAAGPPQAPPHQARARRVRAEHRPGPGPLAALTSRRPWPARPRCRTPLAPASGLRPQELRIQGTPGRARGPAPGAARAGPPDHHGRRRRTRAASPQALYGCPPTGDRPPAPPRTPQRTSPRRAMPSANAVHAAAPARPRSAIPPRDSRITRTPRLAVSGRAQSTGRGHRRTPNRRTKTSSGSSPKPGAAPRSTLTAARPGTGTKSSAHPPVPLPTLDPQTWNQPRGGRLPHRRCQTRWATHSSGLANVILQK
jgi:hypothetical protein